MQLGATDVQGAGWPSASLPRRRARGEFPTRCRATARRHPLSNSISSSWGAPATRLAPAPRMPMRALVFDLRLALRSLAKHRTVTTVAVATLALSIGITTAVFSVVNAVVLRPLPFAAPERLVALCEL